MGIESTHESAAAVAPLPHERSAPHEQGPAGDAELSHAHVPVHYRPKTRKSVTVFAVLAALGLLAAFLAVHFMREHEESALRDEIHRAATAPIPVDVVHVTRAAPEKLYTLPGDARSFYETTIFARINGYVRDWSSDIGDRVTKNQVLATIETPELDDQVNEAKAKVDQMQAQANVALTSLEFAKISYDRWAKAAPDGVVSEQERDQKKAELDSCKAKLEAAKSEVRLGQAQLQQLQTLEKFKNVVAPFDGIITQRHIDIGALVTAGSTTNTSPLYTISQAHQIRIFVDVPQPALPNIHVGMDAYAEASEIPGRKFPGKVDRTASSLDMHSRSLRVEVLADNPDLLLLPGMYLQVTFQLNRAEPPVRIPPAALTFSAHGPQVAVVGADGRISFRPITIGRDLGDAVEIASGLKEGDMVALNVGSQVAEGERVEAHFIDTAPRTAPSSPMRTAKAEAEAGR